MLALTVESYISVVLYVNNFVNVSILTMNCSFLASLGSKATFMDLETDPITSVLKPNGIVQNPFDFR